MIESSYKGGVCGPTANLLRAEATTWDYGNGIKVSFSFVRYNSTVVFLELRDILILINGTPAADIIKDLRCLADRLEETCVNAIKEKK